MKVRETVEQQPDGKDGRAAPQRVQNESFLRISPAQPRLEGKHERDADDEEKEGKDHVGRSPSIPPRMLQRPVGCAAARVVDQDHGGDRGAAEDIKRNQPPCSSSGFENWPYNFWTCAGYAGHVTGFYRLTGAREMFHAEHSLASDIASSNCGGAALSGNGHCNPRGDKSSLICSAGAGAVGSSRRHRITGRKPQRFEAARH